MIIQCLDKLNHGGITYAISPLNLECLGDHWAMVAKDDADYPRMHSVRLSACWRGYVAYWEIVGEKLHLVRFNSLANKSTLLPVQQALENKPLPALQFSGELRSELKGLVGTVYEQTRPLEHAWLFEHGVLQSRVLRAVYVPTEKERNAALRAFIDSM
jgi:hypothetical protein